MKKDPMVYSFIYKDLIDKNCLYLQKKLDIKYFACYIAFNNGHVFVLSNTYEMLNEYYDQSLYKQDYSFRKETVHNLDFYLCDDKVITVSDNFKNILENKYGMFRSYYIIRNCNECRFIFGAIKDKRPEDHYLHYKRTLHDFEDFCCDFVDSIVDTVKNHNHDYNNSIILNDRWYRKVVIKNQNLNGRKLSKREIECLYFASQGKTACETAELIGTSEQTVNSHRKQILYKLDCTNMAHAVFEGIKNGYIGCFNNWWLNDSKSINEVILIDA